MNTTYSNNPNTLTLLDQNGQPTKNFLDTWGITYETCQVFCVGDAGFVDWNSFSTQLSSWLLPWLALTAQLPFETKSTFSNFQALFMAIGSPLLIIYSLSLMMLNARSINDKFHRLKDRVKVLDLPKQTKAVNAARLLLTERPNIPIQVISGLSRELAQLVVDPVNWTWWPTAVDEIMKTNRGWTYSLIAQLGLVVVSQLLSIVDYFTSKTDEDTISVGLGINSVWVWMIPVTLGWVLVGTQTSTGSIKEALESTTVPKLCEERNVKGRCVGLTDRTKYGTSTHSWPTRPGSSSIIDAYVHAHTQGHERERAGTKLRPEEVGMKSQEGLEMGSLSARSQPTNLSSNPSRSDDRRNTIVASQDYAHHPQDERGQDLEAQFRALPRKSFLGLDIARDDEKPGPIFNYACVWSHMNAVSQVVCAFDSSITRQINKYTVQGTNVIPWVPNDNDSNLPRTPEQMSRYISENYEDIEDLPVHSDSLPVVRRNCVIAAIVAYFLFWGTTGAGFLIAYE